MLRCVIASWYACFANQHVWNMFKEVLTPGCTTFENPLFIAFLNSTTKTMWQGWNFLDVCASIAHAMIPFMCSNYRMGRFICAKYALYVSKTLRPPKVTLCTWNKNDVPNWELFHCRLILAHFKQPQRLYWKVRVESLYCTESPL